jgi:L-ascorbate metabolism protein UlaG (beta-lactamase superfamily)
MKQLFKQFGGPVTEQLKKEYEKSPNWKAGKFENLTETTLEFSFSTLPAMLRDQFSERSIRQPEHPLPIVPFDAAAWQQPGSKFIWYGHSVVLLQINGLNILIDPMLGPDASPIAPFTTKRFSEDSLAIIEQLPKLDLVLMSHDHYDHLDYASIERLKHKTGHFYVALGVGRHLQAWGISADQITEFDWWDEAEFQSLKIVFTPSRHFSGRGLSDRAKSLWGGWVMLSEEEKIYMSGDGGYGPHFQQVNDTYGPFDLGFSECGQYSEYWADIHMTPEESVQAALDGGMKRVVPVHWGGFALAMHAWQEPAERFYVEAERLQQESLCPEIGTIVSVLNPAATRPWWRGLK